MEWEAIVNQHSNAKANRIHNKRMKKYSRRVMASSGVAIVFLTVTACGLVQPVLGIPVMVVSLMIGCYNLGRAKECSANVHQN